MRTPTVGSLFSGVGGIELGFERAGFQTAWQVENDPYAIRVLEKHWPTVPRYPDVRYFLGGKRWRSVRSAWSVDCLAGGFPCQDISNAGKRAGIDGERSGLWSEFARIIRLLRPRFVFVENARALTVRGLDRVLGDLAALGYDAEWDCIPAAAVGAPHLRWRIFIVADATGARARAVPEGRRQEGEGEAHAHGHCQGLAPHADGRRCQRLQEIRGGQSVAGDCGTVATAHAARNGWVTWRPCDPAEEPGGRKSDRSRVGATLSHPASRWQGQLWRQQFAAFCESQRNLYWPRSESGVCLLDDGISPTVDDVANRVDQLRCLGNAVVPQVVEWIAGKIYDAIQEEA